MKIVNIVLLIISAIMGLVGCEKSVINEDGVIVVDVTAKYPKRILFCRILWMWNIFL